MENVAFSNNVINSTALEGMYIDNLDGFGYNMFDYGSCTVGSVLVNNNTITSNGDGIYVGGLGYFGAWMQGNATFTMANIDLSENVILSVDHGINLHNLWRFGYNLQHNASATLGNVTVTDNVIMSALNGVNFDAIYDFGIMANDAMLTVGDFAVRGNLITSGGNGIFMGRLDPISGNVHTGEAVLELNVIGFCDAGIRLTGIGGLAVRGNFIGNCSTGIHLVDTAGNLLYYNVLNNTVNAYDNGTNLWDLGYPMGGNSWYDYAGVDVANGPYQNLTGSDGIGDTPYAIGFGNQDRYPLMTMQTPGYLTVYAIDWGASTYYITLLCNSTLSTFSFNQPSMNIRFNLTETTGTAGYCSVTVPHQLLGGPYVCLLDDVVVSPATSSNATHTTLYFAYTHSSHQIEIVGTTVIPEFPALLAPALLLTVLVLTLLMARTTRAPRRP
jgi:hypothetical protein